MTAIFTLSNISQRVVEHHLSHQSSNCYLSLSRALTFPTVLFSPSYAPPRETDTLFFRPLSRCLRGMMNLAFTSLYFHLNAIVLHKVCVKCSHKQLRAIVNTHTQSRPVIYACCTVACMLRALLQNFLRDEHGTVYERTVKPVEVDARAALIRRARAMRTVPTAVKERTVEAKTMRSMMNSTMESGTIGDADGLARAMSTRATLEVPYEVQTEKQVSATKNPLPFNPILLFRPL